MSKEAADFLIRWNQEKTAHMLWGKFVAEQLDKLACHPNDGDSLLSFPASWRLKEDQSLLSKAFRRGKNYDDPWSAIEDKVGCRLIVLTDNHVIDLSRRIIAHSEWDSRVDRKLTELEQDDPKVFGYTAEHIICSPIETITIDGVEVGTGVKCEIQIKTQLQNAWSEMSHETTYKPYVQANSKMLRYVTKGKALVDIASDYFTNVYSELDNLLATVRELTMWSSRKYEEYVHIPPSPTDLEGELLLCLEPIIQVEGREVVDGWIDSLFAGDTDLGESIAIRSIGDAYYAQPSIVPFYALLKKRRTMIETSAYKPQEDLIEEVLTDLGIGNHSH